MVDADVAMTVPDLADPDVEPTDAELLGLATRAFAGIRAAQEQTHQRIRAEIAAERERSLARLDARAPARAGG